VNGNYAFVDDYLDFVLMII